jgi:hypothetical protein
VPVHDRAARLRRVERLEQAGATATTTLPHGVGRIQ